MSDAPQRSMFMSVALMLGACVLVGGNVYFGTLWYKQREALKSAQASAAVATQQAATAAALAATAAATTPPVTTAPTAPPKDLPPLANDYKIVNGHDHLYRIQDFERYLPAATAMGVAKTLFVASSTFTIKGKEGNKEEGNDVNSKEVIACAAKYPDKVIPFVTLTPATPDKIALLEGYVAQGAKGLKLYTGHNDFHDRPLDDPEMLPVYEWLEKNQFPIIWHVNLQSYREELTRVLMKFPKLKVIIPHFGVGFFDTRGKVLDLLGEIMDTYPNVYTDTSFGTRGILVSGLQRVSAFPQLFRTFYEKYQDRIVFGTDMVVTGTKEKTTEWMASVIRACREMHEKADYTFWMAAAGGKYADKTMPGNPTGALRGLNLSPEILKKIYETNIEKFLTKS